LLCVQWKTPDDGQRNPPKHVDFHSKNKFEKLVHLVGFIVRNLSRCTVTWTANSLNIYSVFCYFSHFPHIILKTSLLKYPPPSPLLFSLFFRIFFHFLSLCQYEPPIVSPVAFFLASNTFISSSSLIFNTYFIFPISYIFIQWQII